MKEVKNLTISAPNHATGYRLSDGFYIEWFSGSKSEGWSLISSSHHDIRSVDTSKPVIEIERPRTKTEYELLCNSRFNVWGLKDLLESGSLFYFINDEYRPVSVGSDIFAIEHFLSGHIYRKVETEIDERQEFIDTYASLRHEFHGQRTYDDFSGFMYDSGKFKLVGSND